MKAASIHPDVTAVRRLHAELYARRSEALPLAEWVENQAQTLRRAHAEGNRDCAVQLRNGLPRAASLTTEELLDHPLELDEARRAVAREHGFDEPPAGDGRLDPVFEACLDALVAGNLDGLRDRLREEPSLVLRRSPFGHGATLLHYLVANGTEIARQEVPVRAPHAAVILLEAGAEVDAPARVYGAPHTALALLASSEHPRRVGVTRDLRHVLLAAGARE